jgi:hypothetical protein
MQADLVIVVARTATDPDNRRKGLTLLVVEDGMPGFVRGRELEKMGCKVQDTAELSFVDVRVPMANVLGEEGEAFGYLGHNLPQERLTVAVGSVSQARSAIAAAIDYVKEPQGVRHAGRVVPEHQVRAGGGARRRSRPAQAMLDRAVALHVEGELTAPTPRGEAVLHRDAAARDRSLPAAVRRLRLHDGVPDRPAVHGCAGGPHLRGYQRGHEGDHRQVARVVRRERRVDVEGDGMSDFSERAGIAFVAGGTGGIGSAIVRTLARRGSDVVFSYRANRDAADALAHEVKQFGRRVFGLRLDLGDESATAHAVSARAEALGGIHTLVYAAGPHVPMVHLSKVSPSQYRAQLEADAVGFYNLVHPALPLLRASRGNVVAVTTVATRRFRCATGCPPARRGPSRRSRGRWPPRRGGSASG